MHETVGELVGRLGNLVTEIVERLGYVGVALLVALENVFPPIPSELILPLAGFLCAQGTFLLPVMVLAATMGSVGGGLVLYGVGARLGEARVRRAVRRYGQWLTLDEQDLDSADSWFDRHGGKAVFLGRLAPLIRSLVSIPAGFRRMPVSRFVLYTAAGSALWNSALIGAGWALGDRWHVVERYASILQYAVVAAIVVGLTWFVIRRRDRLRGGRH